MDALPAAELAARRAAFRRLHASGCFVIPNPWDAGSAKFLASLGFSALATTSSGFAWSRGRADGSSRLDEVIEHLRGIVRATPLPVNADFEAGYAEEAAGVAANVRLAIDAGVAGVSIEDATGRPGAPPCSRRRRRSSGCARRAARSTARVPT
jgi:2-methylisocitrate lyase-like PEP mutase family enzyme